MKLDKKKREGKVKVRCIAVGSFGILAGGESLDRKYLCGGIYANLDTRGRVNCLLSDGIIDANLMRCSGDGVMVKRGQFEKFVKVGM